MRHTSLVSAIWSRCRQGDKRKKRQREEGSAQGKLFACESKTFMTRAAVKAKEKGRGRHIYRRATSFSCPQSPERSAAEKHSFIKGSVPDRKYNQSVKDMKTGKKSFIGRSLFNRLSVVQIVLGIMCSLSAAQ